MSGIAMGAARLVMLACCLGLGLGQAAAADQELARFTKNNVQVVLTLTQAPASGAMGTAILQAAFTPDHPDLHLYSLNLPADADAGVATALSFPPGGLRAIGTPTSSQHDHLADGLLVYPPGPILVTQLVQLPAVAGPSTIIVSYMACTESSCRIPVIKFPVAVTLPAGGGGAVASTATTAPASATSTGLSKDEITSIVREAVGAALARESASAVRWMHPQSLAEAKAMIDQAHSQNQGVLLDFTGPSCNNCQLMEKTVFRLPAVVKATKELVCVSLNTDPPHEDLAGWEQDRFRTQNRPLYVVLGATGEEQRWNQVFSPSDQATVERFTAFLRGAQGSDRAGSAAQFWLFAVLGGLVTLVMPCTYPMIPFTINVFSKQAAAGTRLLPLALFYSGGIVACFVGLGVLITGVFGAQLSTVAGHPLTNLLIGLLFAVLGLSLMGAFLLQLPAGLMSSLGGARAGYVGALVMGLTFAITAFSCTAPFAGSVLAEAVASGTWTKAVFGMAVYGGTVAAPFFLIAMSPSVLTKLPRAGAWMNEFKVVGGIVELAAALKFLAICDYDWHWGIIGRSFTLAVWATSGLLIASYVLGLWRFASDEKVQTVALGRLLVSGAFLALALWFAAGLCGANLGLIEAFFPGDPAPG